MDPANRHRLKRDFPFWVRLSLAFAAVALVYFYRLDRPLLWGDEADTGIEARNVLRFGYPAAYDGRNIGVYENGVQFNRSLLSWTQFYVGGLSLALFGNHTAGLRWLFALAGLLAFFPIRAVLKPRVRHPDIMAALVLLAPQTVMFQRNARYYSLLILLYAVLVWHLSTTFKSNKTRLVVASLVLILLFHTQSFAAISCCVALVVYCWFFRRQALSEYVLASGLGLLSWLVWYELAGPSLRETALRFPLITSDFASWFASFCTCFLITIMDLDVVDCVPLTFWGVAVALLVWRGHKAIPENLREPVFSFILISLVVQAAATAALFGCEMGAHYAILRYMPHLLALAIIPCFVWLNSAIRITSLYVAACIAAVAFNLMTLSFWARPYSRTIPVSWVVPVYSEVFRSQEDPWEAIVDRLRREAHATPNHDTPIAAYPRWTSGIAIFYLGDSYLVRPILKPGAEQAVCKAIGDEAYRRLFAQPEWIVNAADRGPAIPEGYVPVLHVPSHRAKPDDGTRPELTRHTFPQSAVLRNLTLYHRQETVQ